MSLALAGSEASPTPKCRKAAVIVAGAPGGRRRRPGKGAAWADGNLGQISSQERRLRTCIWGEVGVKEVMGRGTWPGKPDLVVLFVFIVVHTIEQFHPQALKVRQSWVLVPALALILCVTLSKLVNFES